MEAQYSAFVWPSFGVFSWNRVSKGPVPPKMRVWISLESSCLSPGGPQTMPKHPSPSTPIPSTPVQVHPKGGTRVLVFFFEKNKKHDPSPPPPCLAPSSFEHSSLLSLEGGGGKEGQKEGLNPPSNHPFPPLIKGSRCFNMNVG